MKADFSALRSKHVQGISGQSRWQADTVKRLTLSGKRLRISRTCHEI
jgi:hypothetical protein